MNKYQVGKEFLSNMSHEVRTPLNVIIGMCDIALRHADDREKVESCLKKISIAGDHLIDLVDNLLDMTKIEQECIEVSERKFDIGKLTEDLKVMTESEAARKSLVFDITDKDIVNRELIGDYGNILRVLINIVSNAVKYTPDGGFVRISVRELYSDEPGRTTYEFVCRDNGIGMSDEFLEDIYKPFVRADDMRVIQTNGSGLGMAIVKKIVDALSGDISISSSPGSGTTVTVRLGFEVAGNKRDINEIREQEKERITDEKIVLIAEDQKDNREVLLTYLEDLGIKADAAVNGEEAVDMFISSEPGLYKAVFMDIEMPVLDGYQASVMIRGMNRDDSDLPIIALTANAFPSDREKAARAGIDHYLTKPLRMDDLSELLNDADSLHLF